MLRFIPNDLTGRIFANCWAKWLIGAILLIALVLRVRAVSFGLPAMNDPDELIFELGAVKMLREGTLNPGWFGHPATTTLYLLAAIDVAVFAVGHALGWFPTVQAFGDAIYQDPIWVVLPSRTAMALFGVWCVFLTDRLGERLFDRRVGLVAAALLAISPIHISYSQIVRSDVMATAFLLLMLLASLDFLRTGKWKSVLTAALWFGFATTTKWPFAACAISFAAAALYRFWTGKDRLADTMRRLAGFGCAGIVAILLISPYLALDYKTALQSVMGEAQVRHVGATGQGALWNAGWYLRGPLLHALGWPGLALSAIGGVIAARKREPALLFFPLIAVLVAVTLPQNLIWARWILPLLPLLTILAAAAFAAAMERSCMLPPLTRRTVTVALYAATFTPLLLAANSDAAERMNDTRQAASHWADTHLQPGSSVMVEHFGFDLLSRPWEFYFPLADAGCVNARQMLHGKVQYAAVEAVRGGHHNVDYGTLTPAMRPTCNVQYAIFSQYDRYMAEASMFPREVASYRELMARSHLIATIRPQPGVMGGPTIRIVRIDSPYQVPQARGRNGGL
ncbi:MAG: hypothetical protein RLZZ84_1070 [Pseudomonadota bacterium]|jgi:4-amino-4-deoxy-L-arabinose transferase-like glycosyltransferase